MKQRINQQLENLNEILDGLNLDDVRFYLETIERKYPDHSDFRIYKNSDGNYDSYQEWLELCATRLETEDEYQLRLNKEKLKKEKAEARIKARKAKLEQEAKALGIKL